MAEEPVTEADPRPQPARSVSQAGLAEQPIHSSAAPVKRPRGTAAMGRGSCNLLKSLSDCSMSSLDCVFLRALLQSTFSLYSTWMPRKYLRQADVSVSERDSSPLPFAGRPKKHSGVVEQPNAPRKARAGRPSAQDEDSPEDVIGVEDLSPEARSFRYLGCRAFTSPSAFCHAGDVRASPVWHGYAYTAVMTQLPGKRAERRALETPELQEGKCIPGSCCLGTG